MTRQTVLRELIWLLVVAGLTALSLTILFASERADIPLLEILSGDASLDINLHDNYFVIDFWWLFILAFVTIAFVTYAIKEGLNKFSRIVPNCFLLVVTILFIVQTVTLISTVNQMLISWTVYPPLSALVSVDKNPFLNTLIWILYSILTVASIIFVFVSFKTIKAISKNKNA